MSRLRLESIMGVGSRFYRNSRAREIVEICDRRCARAAEDRVINVKERRRESIPRLTAFGVEHRNGVNLATIQRPQHLRPIEKSVFCVPAAGSGHRASQVDIESPRRSRLIDPFERRVPRIATKDHRTVRTVRPPRIRPEA
jgi:hypothetical protein